MLAERFKNKEFENNTFNEQTEKVKREFAEHVVGGYINISRTRKNKIKQFNQRNSLLNIRARRKANKLKRKIRNRLILENSIKDKNTQFEDELSILLQLQAETEAREKEEDLDSLLDKIKEDQQQIELPQRQILRFEPITFKRQTKKHTIRKKTNL